MIPGFKNEFVVSGFCKRINEMKDDKGKVSGLYVTIATIGDSYSVYVGIGIPGYDSVKVDVFLEIHGHLKTKFVVSKNEKASSIAGLGVDKVLVSESPLLI